MANEARPVVGFIGLGRMGLPMCRNLLGVGVPLIVYNRTRAKAEALREEGARVAESVAALAAECDVVLACLDTLAASEAVFLGDDGVIAHVRRGALLIDHATIAPELAVRIAQQANARGLAFLDAPVSGGPEGAANRALAIMVGGDTDAFARALPVLRSYGSTIVHMGPAGSGTYAKLVNQVLTFVHGAVAAEAIALAERLGLDIDALAGVLRAGFGQSRMLDRTLARVRARDYEAGAALEIYGKDLGIVASLANATGLRLPVTDGARAILAEAQDAGLGNRDIAALHLRYEPLAPSDGARQTR